MSKTLKLDTLKGFKPKGVNVDRSIIDDALKEFNNEPNSRNDETSKVKASPLVVQDDVQAAQTNFQQQLDALKVENDLLKSQNKSLSVNEQKLLNAIKSEQINQDIDSPVMSRAIFKSKYGMNEKYIGTAIKGLTFKELIERYPAKLNGQNTFSWKIF